jgi:hypothetical protein
MAKAITMYQDDNGITFRTESDADVSNAKIAFAKQYERSNGLWARESKVESEDFIDYLCDNKDAVRELMLVLGI